MTSERRLWLVRHGETEGQSSIRYHGANDVALSDLGRSQIRDLVPLIEGASFSQVVHSPLIRASESAAILVDGLAASDDASNLLIRVDDRLREISFGACEGLTREEIHEAHPSFWAEYEAGKLDAFPGGEARQSFASRIAEGIHELASLDWVGDALVVAHRGTVKHAIQALLGASEPPQAAYGVELGSLSVLRQTSSGWHLEALGVRP
jgi:broad specificity phosphatase PhoE